MKKIEGLCAGIGFDRTGYSRWAFFRSGVIDTSDGRVRTIGVRLGRFYAYLGVEGQ